MKLNELNIIRRLKDWTNGITDKTSQDNREPLGYSSVATGNDHIGGNVPDAEPERQREKAEILASIREKADKLGLGDGELIAIPGNERYEGRDYFLEKTKEGQYFVHEYEWDVVSPEDASQEALEEANKQSSYVCIGTSDMTSGIFKNSNNPDGIEFPKFMAEDIEKALDKMLEQREAQQLQQEPEVKNASEQQQQEAQQQEQQAEKTEQADAKQKQVRHSFLEGAAEEAKKSGHDEVSFLMEMGFSSVLAMGRLFGVGGSLVNAVTDVSAKSLKGEYIRSAQQEQEMQPARQEQTAPKQQEQNNPPVIVTPEQSEVQVKDFKVTMRDKDFVTSATVNISGSDIRLPERKLDEPRARQYMAADEQGRIAMARDIITNEYLSHENKPKIGHSRDRKPASEMTPEERMNRNAGRSRRHGMEQHNGPEEGQKLNRSQRQSNRLAARQSKGLAMTRSIGMGM